MYSKVSVALKRAALTAAVGLVRAVRAVALPVAQLRQRHAARAVVAAQRGRRAVVGARGAAGGGRAGGGRPGAAPLVRAVQAVHAGVAAELLHAARARISSDIFFVSNNVIDVVTTDD